MANFSAWGAEAAPDRLIRQDALKEAQVAAQTQEALGRIAMQPDLARRARAEANKLEFEVDQATREQALMARAMGIEPEGVADPAVIGDTGVVMEAEPQKRVSIADRFDRAANTFAGAGLVTRAQKLAETAALIRQREASAKNSEMNAALDQLKIIREQAEGTAQFFGGATDQASLDTANALYTFQTGRRSPFEGMEYSPELVESINQQALTAKERYDVAERAARNKQRERYENERLKDFEERRKLLKERNHLAREREDRLRKQGGRTTRLPAAEPKDQEVKQVKNLIRRDYPFMADTRDQLAISAANEAAFTIASEARALMRANPALSTSAAINQAYATAVREGDFDADPGFNLGFTRAGAKFRFAGGGRSPETALMVPTEKDKLKSGRYYVNSTGQIARWNGSKFVPATPTGDNRRVLSDDNARTE